MNEAEKSADVIINDYVKGNIDFNTAKSKVLKVDNVNLIDIDEEETEEKEYFNTLKTKFFTVITDYDFKRQFPDSKTDI